METTQTGTAEPLQTVGEALGEQDLKLIASLIGAPQKAVEASPEAASEAPVEPEAAPEAPVAAAETDNTEEPAKEGAEVEAAGAASEEETPEPSDKLAPEVQERINKRIGKEVAKTKRERELREAAEAELAQVKARLEAGGEQVEAKQAAPVSQQLESVETLEALGQVAEQAEQVVEASDQLLIKLRRQPEAVEARLRALGVKVLDENGAEDYSSERMEEFLMTARSNADRLLRKEVPRRHGFLLQKAQSDAIAEQDFPWWKDKTSKEYQDAQAALRALPALKQVADWKHVIGAYLEGVKVVEERKKAKEKKPAAKPPAVPVAQPSVPAPASRKSPSAAVPKQQLSAFFKTGSERDLAEALKASGF